MTHGYFYIATPGKMALIVLRLLALLPALARLPVPARAYAHLPIAIYVRRFGSIVQEEPCAVLDADQELLKTTRNFAASW
jgi:hypothetical protein